MKIQEVQIKKFKKLEDFSANLEGKNVFIMGENGLGKSSFIQFIQIALGDNKHIPENFKGEGVVIATKDNGIYTFKVKEKGGKPLIEVTSPDGLKDIRKSAISAITGAMEFDIDEFVELSNSKAGQKKQVEIFKSFLPTEIIEQLNKFDAHIKALYDERTDVNKQIKEVESIVNTHTLRHEMDLTKFKSIDVSEQFNLLSKATEHNKKVDEVKTRLEQRHEAIKALESNFAEIEAQIKALQEKQQTITVSIKQQEELNGQAIDWLNSNKPIDVSEIQKTIEQTTEINKKAEQAQQLILNKKILEEVVNEAGDLTVRIESERQAIADTIRQMESPVEGLTFDDDILVYNNIPVNENNLSTSEIMELGIRLKMAENPEFGVIFLQRGESLGNERLKLIQELAEKNNFQLIIEEVQRGQEELAIQFIGE
jgi:DNA repair exonuclease SbcCD ATPase subunit